MRRQKLQPYPGLRSFERYESRIFFGRQQQVDELLTRLKQHHFLAVIGASGSGKSSLVKAGLLPGLEKGYMGEVGSRWSIAEMRPGEQPFVRLAEALLGDKAFREAWATSSQIPAPEKQITEAEIPPLTAELRRGSRSLHEILELSPLPEGTRLLLLIDQFEEIFRFRELEENQAAAFVSLLLEACRHRDIYVVITMRSDFLGAAVEFHGLPEAINDGLYLTPRLTREQLREAICLPAQLFGGAVEDALANHLLNEAGNDPDQLPLLQHALMRMWEGDADKILTLEEYRGLDDLRQALDGHAEQVWGEIDAAGQAIAESMFRALTERSRDGQYIRRPLKVQTLLEMTATDLPTLTGIVDVFRQTGRNFLMPPPDVPLTADTTLDISHESLIRQWQRLQGWVKAEGEKAAMYLRLRDAAQRHAGMKGELWHGMDLALALEWQAGTQPNTVWAARYGESLPSVSISQETGEVANGNDFDVAMKFLQASKAETQRQQQEQENRLKTAQTRRRFFNFLFAVGLAVWIAAVLNQAEAEKKSAQNEAAQAKKSEEESKAETDDAEKLYQKEIDADPKNADKLGDFAVFMKNVRKDNDRAEKLYQQAIDADPKNARNLGNYAIFMKNVRKDNDRAEKLYQQAIAAAPKNADILGNYALFMQTNRKDNIHAQKLYQQAIAADPKHANNLGNYAVFTKNIRKDFDQAEKLYQQAIAADSKNANNLGNYAMFMQTIRKDYVQAEKLYRRAIEVDPRDTNHLANFAQLKLTRGSYKEGRALIDQSFAANPEEPALKLELWFYRLAHFPQDYPQSQKEIVALLKTGARDEGWDFSGSIAQAEKDGHPNVALLKAFSDVILAKAKFETLTPYLGK